MTEAPPSMGFAFAQPILQGWCEGFGFLREWRQVMKNRRIAAALVLAGTLASSASIIAVAQNAGRPGEAASPAAPATPPRQGGGLVILDFKPALDDLMTMLIQPRHIKLYYAGEAKNWKLAGFELDELRAGLARIGRTIPNYRNNNVDGAVAAIFADTVKTVDAAIKAQDATQFTAAYRQMTDACNACHTGMEHQFLVIKVPDAMNYPDQEFRP
jgi:hypothetical protein